jgi:predicted RNA-binding protein YlqC (UPF0109 family)
MVELVKYMVDSLVDNKDAVVITEENDVVKVSVDKKDMGKIIGRGGKIAKAMRAVVRAAGIKRGKKYTLDILEADGADIFDESDGSDEPGGGVEAATDNGDGDESDAPEKDTELPED